MKLPGIFDIHRYRRCMRLFRRPLVAHLTTSLPLGQRIQLPLKAGGMLQFPADVRRSRRSVSRMLDEWPDPFPMLINSEGLLEFQHGQRRFVLRANSGDFFTFQEIMVEDSYGFEQLPGRMDTVVDLGANIGLFAVRAAAVSDRVICVEPLRSNIAIAQRNLQRAATGNVTWHEAAICGDSSGDTVSLFSSDDFPAGSSIFRDHAVHWGQTHEQEVQKITIAELFARESIERCSLLKCDIEGAEYDAFEAVPPRLLDRIDRIVMEVHMNVSSQPSEDLWRLCQQLKSAGFEVQHFKPRRWWGGYRRAVMLSAVNRKSATDIGRYTLKRPRKADLRRAA